MTTWIVVGIVVLIGLWLIMIYNGLVGGRTQTQTAWSQIDVQLKRRHDLIPNLVQVVKDAMGYEQETLHQGDPGCATTPSLPSARAGRTVPKPY